MKIVVPTSWADVTLRKFIELSKIPELGFNEADASLKALSILCDVSDELLFDMPLNELNVIISKIEFLKETKSKHKPLNSLKLNGNRYSINYNAKKLCAGEYIDMQNYIKGGVNSKLNHVLAIYFKPVNIFGLKKKDCYKDNGVQTLDSRNATAEYLLDNLTMDKVFPMTDFFLRNWERLIERTQVYLEKQNKTAMKNLKKELVKAGFSNLTVGI